MQPRLVLLYATCTVARDFLEPYDSSVRYTESLTDFAKKGLVFRRHQTEAGQSGVAFASIFSGSQAPHHQLFRHPARLLDDTVLVSEVFQAAGYDTFAWLNHGMADASLNYAQGVKSDHVSSDLLVAGDPRFSAILQKLKADPTYKAFVVTTFTVTHEPYKGTLIDEFCPSYPDECRAITKPGDIDWARHMLAEHEERLAYDFPNAVAKIGLDDSQVQRLIRLAPILYKADVFRLDRLFGAVVKAIENAGLLNESLIAFTSDHGEVLYRDDALFHWTHGYELRVEDIQVPLILVGPRSGVPHGDYAGVSRSIDILPTLAGLAGIEAPQFEGRGEDLTPAIRGKEAPPALRAFSHTILFNRPIVVEKYALRASLFPAPLPDYMWVSVRDGDLYVTRTRNAEDVWSTRVYDLATDPHQEHDSFDASNPRHRELEAALADYKKTLVDAAYAQLGQGDVPCNDVIERLRRLGYTQ